MAGQDRTIATTLEPVVTSLLGTAPTVGLRFWDGSTLGRGEGATLVLRSPLALSYLLYAPGELGLARAYVSGELELEGDVYAALGLREQLAAARGATSGLHLGAGERLRLLQAAFRVGALRLPPSPPPEEVRLSGGRHTKDRDAAAISHHYDISNDFYRMVLGETMMYSCAHFATPETSLEDAQRSKLDLVCTKLGLAPGMRLLDVGCGWGGMVLHAARNYGVRAVGITLSREQAARATARVTEADLAGQVEIRVQDYRDVADGPYDAISSIGMFEHVGLSRLAEYFSDLRTLVREEGRVLNHGISRPDRNGGRTGFGSRSFVDRYVFPDGELHEVGTVVSAMQDCGLEVRDVECLREHYARTLRAWVANLEAGWEKAVALVGAGRARVWRLYMAASALNFAANRTSLHQVLGVRTGPGGRSGMPATRAELLAGGGLRTGAPSPAPRSPATT